MPFVTNYEVLNHFNFNSLFLGMFYTHASQYLGFDTSIELNMFFTYVVVCGGIGGGVRLERGMTK